MQKSEAGQREWVVKVTEIGTVDFRDCTGGLQIGERIALIMLFITASIT